MGLLEVFSFLYFTVIHFLTNSVAALALAGAPSAPDAFLQEAGYQEASAPAAAAGPYRFEPGAGIPALLVPRQERLTYRAYADVAFVTSHVGKVTQTCAVEEQPAPLLVTQPAAAGEKASIQLHASGSYLWYDFESTLETRILPQEWPRLFYAQTSKGSQTRRREILLGRNDGKCLSSYRGDTSNGAPPGTRIWRAARERAVPEGTLDMLSAVFMARTLMREQKEVLTFPLIDKDRLWKLDLRRGQARRMETPAGAFDVIEVVLNPTPYPGEDFGEEKTERFEGVFGINGSIHLWVEQKTGIAVRIQGTLPIGDDLITVGIDVILESYSGTPADFAPAPAKK